MAFQVPNNPLRNFSRKRMDPFLLNRRVRLYRKIYRRNPHLWDISEYDPAHYYPYEAFELRRNPNLIVSFKKGIDWRWKRATYETIEPKPHETEDILIVWDFLRRCVHRMYQVQSESPEFQAIVEKTKALSKSVSHTGGQWKGKVNLAPKSDVIPKYPRSKIL